MSDSSIPNKIGFPPELLTKDSIRFDVVAANKPYYFAINKPAGILLDSYLSAPNRKSIMLAMREQEGKGEFERLGVKSPFAVNQIDFEASGVGLIACDKDIATTFRNAMWSGLISFEYTLLTRRLDGAKDKFTVPLPILKHEDRNVWIVSHRYGKKATTSFELIETSGDYQIWKATTSVVRPHQIRVHASEVGLKIVGESLYSKTSPIYMSKLKSDTYRLSRNVEEEPPLYPFICCHLGKLSFDGKDMGLGDIGRISIEAKPPKGFALCLKKLGLKTF